MNKLLTIFVFATILFTACTPKLTMVAPPFTELGEDQMMLDGNMSKNLTIDFKVMQKRQERKKLLKAIEKLATEGYNLFKAKKMPPANYAEFSFITELVGVALWQIAYDEANGSKSPAANTQKLIERIKTEGKALADKATRGKSVTSPPTKAATDDEFEITAAIAIFYLSLYLDQFGS
jgi:hypothetical protein